MPDELPQALLAFGAMLAFVWCVCAVDRLLKARRERRKAAKRQPPSHLRINLVIMEPSSSRRFKRPPPPDEQTLEDLETKVRRRNRGNKPRTGKDVN